MPQLVDIPEMGVAEFPDGMAPEQIAGIIRAHRTARLAKTPSMQPLLDSRQLPAPSSEPSGAALAAAAASPSIAAFAPPLGELPGIAQRDARQQADFLARRDELDRLARWRADMLAQIGEDQPNFGAKRAEVEALYKQEAERLGSSVVGPLKDPLQITGEIAGPAAAGAVKVSEAAASDVLGIPAAIAGYTEPFENLASYAERPAEPLPTEQRLRESGAAGIPGRVALTAIGAVPLVGMGALGRAMGMPAPVAAALPIAFTPEGHIDPVGVAFGLGVPFVDKFGRKLASDWVVKELSENSKLIVEPILEAPGQFSARVATRFPALLKENVQRAIEVSGGQVANIAYLTALQTPGILSSDNPKQAIEEAMINSVGMLLLGVPEFRGEPSARVRVSAEALEAELRRTQATREQLSGTAKSRAEPQPPGAPTSRPTAPAGAAAGAASIEKGPSDATTKGKQPPNVPPQPQGGAGGGPPAGPGAGDSLQPAAPQPGPGQPPSPEAELAVRRGAAILDFWRRNGADDPQIEAAIVLARTGDQAAIARIASEHDQLVKAGFLPAEPTIPSGAPPGSPPIPPATTQPVVSIAPPPGSPPEPGKPAANPGQGAGTIYDPGNRWGLPAGIALGRETFVLGANGSRIQARYAWVPRSLLEVSHTAPDLAPNPNYAPLKNTRDYANEPLEKEKLLRGIREYEPYSYVTNVKGAESGPSMGAIGQSGRVYVLGGNARQLMQQMVRPDQLENLHKISEEEAGIFGLGPRRAPDDVLLRLLPDIDLATPEGVSNANLLIDVLNPSPGRIEATSNMARNDAAKVSFNHLTQIAIGSSPQVMREWMRQLIGAGVLDFNTRSQILDSDSQLANYIGQMLIQAAYAEPEVFEARDNPRALATIRGLIDAGVPFLLELRRRNRGDVAESFTEMVRRVIYYQKQYPDRKLDRIFKMVGEQVEINESELGKLVRAIALVLEQDTEIFHTKRGEVRLDDESSIRNYEEFFRKLARGVRDLDAGVGLFDNRTEFDVLRDYVRQRLIEVRGPQAINLLADDVVPYSPLEQTQGKTWRDRRIMRLLPGTQVTIGGANYIFAGLRKHPLLRDEVWARFHLPGQPELWQEIRVRTDDRLMSLADEPVQYERGDDERVELIRAYKRLAKLKEAGKLTQAQTAQLAEVEQKLGQEFLALWAVTERADKEAQERERQRLEAAAAAAKRLAAGPLTTQTQMFDEPGQMTLFEGRTGYFPGFDVPVKPVIDNEPKINTPIEGPAAAKARRDRQLQLGGLREPGERERPGGGLSRREIVTSRRELLPSFFRFTDRLEGFEELWKILRPDQRPRLIQIGKVLATHQREGVNRILAAWIAGENFGLFDGTGAGKTMQELACAAVWAFWTNKPVLIVTERQGVIDDAFAKDAETLDVPIFQYKGGPIEPNQRVLVATYYDVLLGKIPQGIFDTIIFDEAHNLRGQGLSLKAHIGNHLAASAERVLFATATPLDKPEQLWYLKSLLDETPEAALLRIGIETNYRMRGGESEVYFTPVEGITQGQLFDNLENLFDRMYANGRAIKREVPLDNLDVHLKATPLDADAMTKVDDLMEQAEAYYRALGVPERQIVALKLMVGRQALEAVKAEYALQMVKDGVKAGRQVLLYAYRVQDGMWARGNSLDVLANMLEKTYGPGSVGRLYGGTATAAQRAYQAKTLKRFSDGNLKIILATPATAGVGINADDIYGDAPREMILMTAPFSALEAVQLAGRINRLTTRSRAILRILYSGHRIDKWNLGITLAKLRLLKAAVKGDVERLEPTTLQAPKKAYDPAQAQWQFESAVAALGWNAPGQVALSGNDPRRPGERDALPSPINIYAVGFQEQLIQTGKVSVLGQYIPNIHAAGPVFQMMRDPRFEQSWILGLDAEDKVVFAYCTTCQNPQMTELFVGQDDARLIAELMDKHGAVSTIAGHNHPSGDPQPSFADRSVAHSMYHGKRLRIPGLRSVVVIDGPKYALIDATGQVTMIESGLKEDPLLTQPEGQQSGELLGRQVLTADQVARVAQQLKTGAGMASLIFRDTKGYARAFGDVSLKDMANKDEFTKHLRHTGAAVGASGVFVYVTDMAGVDVSVLANLVHSGVIEDALLPLTGRNELVSVLGLTSAASLYNRPATWFGLRDDEITGWRLSDDVERYRAEHEDTMTSAALSWSDPGVSPYNPAAPRTASKKVPIVLGGMKLVKPAQMPEILKLAKALLGDLPRLKKLRGARGLFKGAGAGQITLDPRIFRDGIAAAKTLAHEVGHLIDYLPDRYLARGNLIGRLFTLRNFLKDKFGGTSVKNKEFREELLELTMWWKPWDPAAVSPGYNDYRRSAVELYADALSVLINSPGELAARAPKFYREFWDQLDLKPQVKDALFNLQDLLNKGKLTVLDERRNEIHAMYKTGEEIWKQKMEERRRRHLDWKGWKTEYLELLQDAAYAGEPVAAAARAAVRAGAKFDPALDPRNILEQGLMRDNTNYRFLRLVWEKVIKEIEGHDMSVADLGDLMLWERILNGDRQGLPNPKGHTPETAREMLADMHVRWLKLDKMEILERANRYLHNLVFKEIVEATRIGLYNKQTFKDILKPNQNFYAPFKVLEYLEAHGTPWVIKQFGTFKDIENPFLAFVSQAIALNNMIAQQRDRVAARDLLLQHFPADIEKAEMKMVGLGIAGGALRYEPVPKKDRGLLKVWEDGKPAWYYVDELIARTFEQDSPARQNLVVRALDYGFRRLFYPLYITYNPAFMLVLSPWRDFKRTRVNLPGMFNRFKLATQYLGTFSAAVRYMKSIPDPLIEEMISNFAIGTPWDAFPVAGRPEEDKFAKLLERYHFLSDDEAKGVFSRLWKVARAPLDWIEFWGQVLNVLPKTAAYRILRTQMGMAPAEAAAEVRNYVGVPNIFKHGRRVAIPRAIVPFYNVFVQGWRADLAKMTNPKTAAGWWWRWASGDGLFSVLMALAAAGAFGAVLKALFDGISEYYKTNYNVIPIGLEPGGDFGNRVKFLTLPRDETSRLLSGLVYKLTYAAATAKAPELTGLYSFSENQLPGVNPLLTISSAWAQYAANRQPIDPFLGRPIVPDLEWRAGGLDSLEPMALWTLKETGAQNFIRWDKDANSLLSLSVSAAPGLNRVVRTSDYGYREQQREARTADEQARAREIVDLPDQVGSVYQQYWAVRGIKRELRTPEQQQRYDHLNVWYNNVFRPTHEAIMTAKEAGRTASADAMRARLETMTKIYESSTRANSRQ